MRTIKSLTAQKEEIQREGTQLAANVFKLLSFHQRQLRELLKSLDGCGRTSVERATGTVEQECSPSLSQAASTGTISAEIAGHLQSLQTLPPEAGGNSQAPDIDQIISAAFPTLTMPDDWRFLPFDSWGRVDMFADLPAADFLPTDGENPFGPFGHATEYGL